MSLRSFAREVALLGAAVCVLSGSAEAISGDEWRRLPAASRTSYVLGIVDAWTGLLVVQESLGTNDRAVTAFNDVMTCVRDRAVSTPRITEIVEKYLADHPGLALKDMPDIVFAALSQTCK